MKNLILSVDLGTNSGFAYFNENEKKIIKSEKITFNKKNHEDKYLKFNRFRGYLNDALKDVKMVVYEKVRRHVSADSAHCYGAFEAFLRTECITLGIECFEAEVKTVKKFICGNGNANKDLIIEAVKKRGYNVIEHDEADAIAIMLYFLNKQKIEVLNG